MKKIYYDGTYKCSLLANLSTAPYVLVDDDFKLTKTIQVKVGEKQKVNELGQPLFIKDVIKSVKHDEIKGYTESTMSTFNGEKLEPVMLEVQKTDDNGNNLFYKLDESGQKVETTETTNDPVMIEVHKTNSIGRPLYHKPIIETTIQEVKVGEEEVTDVTDTKAMEDILESKVVDIFTDTTRFTIQEVIKANEQYLKNKYGDDVFYAELVDLEQIASFKGNTGIGRVELAPNTKLKFKPTTLTKECNEVKILDFDGDKRLQIFAENRQLNGEVTKFSESLREIVYSVYNNTNEFLELRKILAQASLAELTSQEKLEAKIASIDANINVMQSALNDIILGGGM